MSSLVSNPLSLFFFSFLLSLLLHFPPTKAWTGCLSTPSYSNGSRFGTNLNLLLSYLPYNASTTGFTYQAIGQAPDRVYGLAQCRGDVTPDECRDCLNTARQEPLNTCPNRTAVTWYDVCLLRYSDRGIGSSSDNSPETYMRNPNNVSDPIRFNPLLSQMMHDLISSATSISSGAPLYATNQTNFSSTQTIYGLVQCTKKLSRSDCRSCLEGAIARIPVCCDGKEGGRVLGSNCFLWFEIFKFYKDLALSRAPPPSSMGPPTDISGALAPPLSAPTPPTLSPQKNETTTGRNGNPSQTTTIIAIAVPTGIGVALILAAAICFLRNRKSPVTDNQATDHGLERNELMQVDLESVRVATDNFCEENKLGQGGFGAVYKGKLSNGQEIAVKRLSRNSGQGVQEFKSEVALVAKLQHRNLVRLLGCCVEGQETILIYEYVPNSSLDNFLFNLARRASLDWVKRYKIIWGIARGLLYLHEDSRLRIIHRDLKASNVLLDGEMNPKISDFGLARIVGLDQTHITASRIAGTYGYMPPEYVVHGQFSIKSDVYSFGVLILEIVTGQKNSSFYESDGSEYLLSYAWKHWRDGTFLEIVDPTISASCLRNEVMRCIHTALLCVQEDVGDRPTMSKVVLMLNSHSVTMPTPSKPAFSIASRMGQDATTEPESQTGEMNKWQAAELSQTPVNEASVAELESH